MKKILLSIAVLVLANFANADILYSNGAPSTDSGRCISGPGDCGGSGAWTVYENFSLTSDSVISGFQNWNSNNATPSAYVSTNWSIWSSANPGFGTAIASGNSLASLLNSGSFLQATVSGLSVALSSGSYFLGINQVTTDVWSYASTNYNSDTLQSDGGNYSFYSNPEMAITIFGVSAVPEVETSAMMLVGLGLMGAMARRRKAKQTT